MKRLSNSLLCLCLLLAACEAGKETPETNGNQPDSPTGRPLSLPSGQTGPELFCAEGLAPLVTDFQVREEPRMAEPERGAPFRDPLFGTCVVRLSDNRSDLSPDDPSTGIKNEYSRVQSFNADGSLVLLHGIEATWYVYDVANLRPLGQLPLGVEPRWSATEPGLIYYISETRLMAYDLAAGQASLVHDFAAEAPGSIMVWTRYEGSPSADGRTWGLMAEDEDWLASHYLVYDLHTGAVVASRDLRAWPADERESDSVTISPLGNYFVVQMDKYCDYGRLGTDDNPCGLMVYDRDLQNGRGLLRIVGHSDLALDAAGREVMVYQDIDNDTISVLDLETGAVTPLWPIDFTHCDGCGMHFSGRAFARPGWALVSYFDGDPATYTWMDDAIFAIELRPGGRVVRLAHHHSRVDPDQEHDYWAEPHASVNQDFTRILFTSNWGRSGTGEVDVFVIQLEQDWTGQIP